MNDGIIKVEYTENMILCEHCGKKVRPGSKFCPSCGNPIGVKPTKTFCQTCGAELQENEQFCNKCGASTSLNKNTESLDGIAAYNETLKADRTKGSKKKKTIKIIVVSFFVLIAIAALSYFFVVPEINYRIACSELNKGHYKVASSKFLDLGNYRDSKEMINECSYQEACNLLESKSYSQAITILEKISYYKNSSDKMHEAMYGYVVSHRNNYDKTTYSYLQSLKNARYKDAATIYNDLYSWSVTAIINSSMTDETTDKSSISRYNSVYCHYTLHGGPPGESLIVNYTISHPNGSTEDGCSEYEMWSGGTSWVGYEGSIYIYPGQYSPTGSMTFKFYDSAGNYLGKDSVYIS